MRRLTVADLFCGGGTSQGAEDSGAGRVREESEERAGDAMKLLALDPAAACGFAWQDTAATGLPQYGVWQLTRGQGEHPGRRLERLRGHLYETHRQWGVERIAFEDASFGGVNRHTQAMHNELRGCIKLVACELDIDVLLVHPTALKAFVAGHGHASKDKMKRAIETHLGIATADDNVADALAVLLWAQAHPNGQPSKKAAASRVTKRRKREPKLFQG